MKSKKKNPTIFSGGEIGRSAQKHWIYEFSTELTAKYVEQKADFALVLPHRNGLEAYVSFLKVADLILDDTFDRNAKEYILEYVFKRKNETSIIVIFMNNNGNIDFYTCTEINLN